MGHNRLRNGVNALFSILARLSGRAQFGSIGNVCHLHGIFESHFGLYQKRHIYDQAVCAYSRAEKHGEQSVLYR